MSATPSSEPESVDDVEAAEGAFIDESEDVGEALPDDVPTTVGEDA